MGGRYLITGVQIGMLLGYLHSNKKAEIEKLLGEIQEDQFIGMSKTGVKKDVEIVGKTWSLPKEFKKKMTYKEFLKLLKKCSTNTNNIIKVKFERYPVRFKP